MSKPGVTSALLVVAVLFVPSVARSASPPKPAITLNAHPFALDRVRLLPGPYFDTMQRLSRYLHELESDRLLYMFRKNAGLPTPSEPMGGWEQTEVRGHTLGHYLSGCALMVASTGDKGLKAKADAIVSELAKCQKNLGPSGYLSAFPESFIERAEKKQPVWAPYYVLHKIFVGLVDMHEHCGNQQALQIACGMADWCKSRCDKLTDEQMQQMLDHTEQGGMNDVLARLYAITGNRDYLTLAQRFCQESYNTALAQEQDELQGQHVNSFIPNIIGTARLYELAGAQRDGKIADYFWHQVVGCRCYSTGGTSNFEHWRTKPNELATELSTDSQESCCTYNMLKLSRRLFTWDPKPEYADYYERALLNSILSTQDPETGMMMYFVPMNPGHWKVFNTPRDSFWCCTGTGMENHAKYGDSIYFHDDKGLYINQYIASELDWREKGVKIRQETSFPEQETATIIVQAKQPVETSLRIRIPYWAKDATISINGQPIKQSTRPSSYLALQRTWQNGDRVEIHLPMHLHLHAMPDDPSLVTVMYGPMVLAGELGTQDLSPQRTYLKGQRDQADGPRIEVPYFVVEDRDPATWISKVEGQTLRFQTTDAGQPNDVTMVPFHLLFEQRYSLYWRVLRKGSPEHTAFLKQEAKRRRRLARTVDNVTIGDPVSEREHDMKGENTQAGQHQGRGWRHAVDGGWFSYRLAVESNQPMTLCCVYWGSDVGPRRFDIMVDDQKIATQSLANDKPGEFFEVEYVIPADLLRNKEKVTVKFKAHSANQAGGVFGCAILKSSE